MNKKLAGIIKARGELENWAHFYESEQVHWVFMGEPPNLIICLEETCVIDYILMHSSFCKTDEDAITTRCLPGYFRRIIMQDLLMVLEFCQTAK